MGYDRNDRRGFGEDRYGGGRGGYGGGYNRDRGNSPSGYRYEDRSFFDRAGDEVRSWFGDEEAERRRRYDERYDGQYEARSDRGGYGRGDWGRNDGERDPYSRGQGNYQGGYQGSQGFRGYDRGGQDYAGSEFGGARYGAQGYGQSRGYGSDRSQSEHNRFATRAGGSASDDSYGSWRDRQLQSFDNDYDEYRRENQSRFETEFASYRTKRQGQREQLGKVQEHMEVVGSDGQHVGKVDHVQGDRIKLAKNDEASGGHHHTIPSSWIETVDDRVTISKTADEAKRAWREESDDNDRNRGGLFGQRDDRDDRGDRNDWSSGRNLNRSFSGTY